MDVLTDVLQAVRLRSEVYGRFEWTAPWGAQFAEGGSPIFHIVSRGSCWLEVEEAYSGSRPGGASGAIPLAGGDFVFLPQGHAHSLRDAPGTPAPPISKLVTCTGGGPVSVHRLGGGGAPTTLVSGCFRFEAPG